jgi:transcriptional regulator with XRE-family HTH domain
VSSPYVRARRFGREIRQARKDAGFTSNEALAKAVGVNRTQIQRLESAAEDGRKTNLELVKRVLPVVGVDEGSSRWHDLMKIAYDANEDGWWRSRIYNRMGERQARWANLEYGARKIQVYEPTNIPGLLQTAAYAAALAATFQSEGEPLDGDAVVAGRMRRQEQVRSAELDIIVEEIAIRRLIVPAEVMVGQLRHLLDLGSSDRVSLRVLPTDAPMLGVRWPREPFNILTYQDPSDPVVVAIEQVGDDAVLIEPTEVNPYERLFSRCKDAAMSPTETAQYLQRAIEELTAAIS